MKEKMIELVNVSKSYSKRKAVDHINLSLGKGEILGLNGKQGTGKSTILKMCTGILKPDQGNIFIEKRDIFKSKSFLSKISGYMPQYCGMYEELNVLEYLEFYASLYGMDGRRSYIACNYVMEKTGLREKKDMMVDMLSREAKQRLGIARSMLHGPRILFLDEPLDDLNSNGQLKMIELLLSLKEEGFTMMVSSNCIKSLEKFCTEIAVLENGNIIVNGEANQVMKEVNALRPLLIIIRKNTEKAIEILKKDDYVKSITICGEKIAVCFIGNEEMEAKLLTRLVNEGIEIVSFAREKGKMEDFISTISI